MPQTHAVAVLGGGSFGTVIANIIASNGNGVRLWLRNDRRCEAIRTQRRNIDYLPDYELHRNLEPSTSIGESVRGAGILFVAVPSRSFRKVVRNMSEFVGPATIVISLTKGIEPGGFRLMSEILAEELPGNPVGVLSGPNLASEIAAGQVSGSVIASPMPFVNSTIHDLLHSESFLIYSSHDMYGVELGGALKNVYAILAGIASALSLGNNTVGMLLTRSLAEMSRFAVHMGANPLTFLGLAGVGDLFVTCSSPLSRNFQVGLALGRGVSLGEILGGMDQLAEGLNTLRLLKAEADRRGVHMPLVNGLYGILHEHRPVAEVFDDIMHREQAMDVEFVTR